MSFKIIVDPVTRQSKGYGFVKFSDPNEAQSAIREMQGILLRGRAIKTNQAHIKASSSTDNTANNMNQNLMLNPLLASLTAGAMPNAYGMMGADNLAMANYAAQQNLQNAQMYQANYLGMQNLAMMPNLQGLQTLQANQALVNPAFGYPANMLAMQNQQGLLMQQGGMNAMQPNQAFSNPNFNYAGGVNPQNQQQQQLYQQQQQAYQQPQVLGAYNPQGTMPGYGTPQQGIQVQMSPQQNPYYAQQGMYQPQQLQQQQQYGYGIQVQTIPTQQQQQPQLYQGMPVQQNGNGPYQYQGQTNTPIKQQPLISPSQLNQRYPSQGQAQKSVQQSPKNQNIGNSPLLGSKLNTLLPAKIGEQSGINAIIPGLNLEPIPQSAHKMEEEKEEDSMVFNPGFIETNFRFDFISSEKMTNIL
jgi:RNA recognition motif-containing protein